MNNPKSVYDQANKTQMERCQAAQAEREKHVVPASDEEVFDPTVDLNDSATT